jgi:rhomboid family GlyGly-CTERM serine protease
MKLNYPIESAVFLLLLAAFNLPGLIDPAAAALFPGALRHGEIWRWFTYPWAHISAYHLLLDATAFLFLYDMLRCGARMRLFHLLSCVLLSGLVPVLFDPRLETIGLRGLSGVAHGLMIVISLQALSSKSRMERGAGLTVFAGVVAKCFIEVFTGSVLFESYHLGNVGLPVPICHFGGALGGALSFGLGILLAKIRPQSWLRFPQAGGPHPQSAEHSLPCGP